MCLNAVDACQRALVSLDSREQLTFRVMPHELIVDEAPVGAGSIVEFELARRLHAASIAQVTIEREASARELARFCFDLAQSDSRNGLQQSLIDVLEEHGVSRIALRPGYRPQVLEVAAPSGPVSTLIAHQRAKRDELFAAGGPVDHLYPPDKGWVRVDPTARFEQVSLVDLALLSQDPATLAGMLLRLTEDDVSDVESDSDALTRKFSDVATLFAALDPRVSRVMFGKLARAVLDLEPDRRQSLLRKTILPGLLDGKVDGTVLRDFPDVDLAESLCLLLDLETAAPEVVTSALSKLDLSAERQAAVMPLVAVPGGSEDGGPEAGRGARRPRAQADAHRSHQGAQLRRIRRLRPLARSRDRRDARRHPRGDRLQRRARLPARLPLPSRAARAEPRAGAAVPRPRDAVRGRARARQALARAGGVARPAAAARGRLSRIAPRRRRGARRTRSTRSARCRARPASSISPAATRPAAWPPIRSSKPSAPASVRRCSRPSNTRRARTATRAAR